VRAVLASALAALALVAAGCGSSRAGVAGSPPLGVDAAKLVPADALAFVSVDTDQSSQQWQALDTLTNGLPLRTELLTKLRAALSKQGLDYANDVKPALGHEVDVAVLKITNGKPDAIALLHPDDESKLNALVSKLSTSSEHYTVQQIGGWSVVADSADSFSAVNAAKSGRSLADTKGYAAARSALGGDVLARAYANGSALAQLPELKRLGASGAPDWVGATAGVDGNALQVHVATAPTAAAETAPPSLLGDVPSGAILAVSFRGSSSLTGLRGVAGTLPKVLGLTPKALAAAGGSGVLYVRASGLIPSFALELRSTDPTRASTLLHALAARLGQRAGGALRLVVKRDGDRVYLADSDAAISDLGGSGAKLVNDQQFKNALAAAGASANPRVLVYADGRQLLPLAEAALPLLGGKTPPAALTDTLQHVGTIVVAAGKGSSGFRATLRVELQK
jgi:hypothetical protein